jgi:hypothetical protein
MHEFFVHRESDDKELWVYSERGLVSYLIHHLLLKDPVSVFRAATNGRQTLYEASGAPFLRHYAVGEFHLYTGGFGSPDGGFVGIRANLEAVFVFIEAKAVLEGASFQDPVEVARRVEGLDWDGIDEERLEELIDGNKFNSSLNGQIELRWRFVNAFQQGARPEMLITEQAVPRLPRELQETDRFYWRRRLRPNPEEETDWRRVKMRDSKETNLLPLYELMHDPPSTRFFLLAITPDTQAPAILRSVRLFTPEGNQKLDTDDFVFWLPLRHIIDDHLVRP